MFVTRYRRPVLSNTMLTDCEQLMHEVCTGVGAELREFNGETDNVHYPPSLALSALVNRLKASHRAGYASGIPPMCGNTYGATPSYFAASCGGAPLTIIKQYIDQARRLPKKAR